MITLTERELSNLRRALASGKNYRDACKAIHRCPHTVRADLKRRGLTVSDLRLRLPRLDKNPQVRWLTQSWRVAA